MKLNGMGSVFDGKIMGNLNNSDPFGMGSMKMDIMGVEKKARKNLAKKPDVLSWNRIKQQKGLDPLGDYDMDKTLNVFDCQPYNKKMQAFVHKTENMVGGNNEQTKLTNHVSTEDKSIPPPGESIVEKDIEGLKKVGGAIGTGAKKVFSFIKPSQLKEDVQMDLYGKPADTAVTLKPSEVTSPPEVTEEKPWYEQKTQAITITPTPTEPRETWLSKVGPKAKTWFLETTGIPTAEEKKERLRTGREIRQKARMEALAEIEKKKAAGVFLKEKAKTFEKYGQPFTMRRGMLVPTYGAEPIKGIAGFTEALRGGAGAFTAGRAAFSGDEAYRMAMMMGGPAQPSGALATVADVGAVPIDAKIGFYTGQEAELPIPQPTPTPAPQPTYIPPPEPTPQPQPPAYTPQAAEPPPQPGMVWSEKSKRWVRYLRKPYRKD